MAGERERIARAHLEQLILQESRRRERAAHADGQSGHDRLQPVRAHDPDHVAPDAPSAMRTPISRVRCATSHAITL